MRERIVLQRDADLGRHRRLRTSWFSGVNGRTGPVIWSTLYISWIRLVIPVVEDLPQRRSWWLDKGILAALVSPGTALTSWSADE
jgi:hypothetical protein